MDSFYQTWFCVWGGWRCVALQWVWLFWWLNFSWDLYWWLNHLCSFDLSTRFNGGTLLFLPEPRSPRNASRMHQLKRVVDHNGQQWHLLGFGDQPPKPDLQKGHNERSVETCRNWIRLFCLNQKGWHFWELEGHLLKLVFFLNSLRPSPPSPPIGWKMSLQQTETYLPISHRKGKRKSEIHL